MPEDTVTAVFMKIATLHATAAGMIIMTGVECAGKKNKTIAVSRYFLEVIYLLSFIVVICCVRFTLNTTLKMSAISRLANCRFKIFFSPCGYVWICGKTYSTEAEFKISIPR